MIEEPEISLHPEAQVEMCRFLAKHAAQGKQILATTHSQFMLLALRRPIQDKTISANDVAVYHVKRNDDPEKGEVGATVAEQLPLANEGYLEEWVPSFSKIERELAREWAAAVERKEQPEKPARRRSQKSA
jgi:predicted ATPase